MVLSEDRSDMHNDILGRHEYLNDRIIHPLVIPRSDIGLFNIHQFVTCFGFNLQVDRLLGNILYNSIVVLYLF